MNSEELFNGETAQKRIKILEQQLVGGEQANNEALKQKRFKKIKEAEKKMQRLAGIINNLFKKNLPINFLML